MQPTQDALDPNETLFIKSRKRFIPVYKPDPREPRELVLHCGMQEISFDEPDLFPWAEKLIEQDSFLASAATGWPVFASITPMLLWLRATSCWNSVTVGLASANFC